MCGKFGIYYLPAEKSISEKQPPKKCDRRVVSGCWGGGENTGDVGYKESCERSKGIVKVVRTLENLWTKFTVSKETLRRNSMVTVKEVERNTTGER